LIFVIGIWAFSHFSSSNTVTGNGLATIKVVPDEVGIYFSVETSGTTSEIATTKNSEIVDALVTKLKGLGLDEDKIQTTGFNVYQDYDWSSGQRVNKGFKATHSIIVNLPTSSSSMIGDVIDAGVSAGAGISYVNFELSQAKQSEYKAQALKAATEDAKVKATAIASGLGKSLGSLVAVSDNSFGYNPWNVYQSMGGASATTSAEAAKVATTDITPSEQEVSASVTAVFKLR
jgi:hypothetical protein